MNAHTCISSRFCYALFLVIAWLSGCMSQTAPASPPASPRISVPPPYVAPATATLPPTATHTAVPPPTSTPPPTATYPPYVDRPFTVVFLRDGNLWLSEIGGGGERQLTTEPADWPVNEYAISPRCDRIAYIVYKGPPAPDALVKQVLIPSGTVNVLTGENDPCIEYSLGWLDQDHITFALSEFPASGHEKDPSFQICQPSFHHLVVNLATGQRTFVPESLLLSQSPNGRYWLTCSRGYVYEGPCHYKLQDLRTGQQWPIAQSIGWGGFIGWSPDSQYMLFTAYIDPEDITCQLFVIDAATRQEHAITPPNKTVSSSWSPASWSPDGRTIAFEQCDVDGLTRSNCALWLVNRDGTQARPIPTHLSGNVLGWTPDGSRLVIFNDNHESRPSVVWSVRLDGTDLRPVVWYASLPQVLCKP